MATSKPEVVITVRRYEIEMPFRLLHNRFSRTPKSMEHRPTSSSVFFWVNSITGFEVDIFPDVENSFQTEPCITWCRSMFRWLWRPRKLMSRRRNCISMSHRHLVITTSGFDVAMLPDRWNSCRTIHNLMLVDIPLTLASSKTYI